MQRGIFVLLTVLLGGGGTLFAQTNTTPPGQFLSLNRDFVFIAGHSVEVVVIETAEENERKEIESKAAALLRARDYVGLEEFAGAFRVSKETWATGGWKLTNVYCGLSLSGKPPIAAWDTCLANLRAWVAVKPESVTARVALAFALTDCAWAARGGGSAGTVSEEGWKLFGARLEQAQKILDDAEKLKARCPVLAMVRMRTALGLSASHAEFDEIFNNAIRAAPDFESYYYRRALFLLPRWHGAPGEWERDLAKSADRIGGKEGDVLYARVVWAINQYSSSVFEENDLSWPRVDRGLAAIEKRFPKSVAVQSEHAQLAVLAGDREVACKCFGQIGGLVALDIWGTKPWFIRCATWACNGKLK